MSIYRFSINSMLAHYLVANLGFKVAPYRFQIAGWWPLVFQPKACCLQSGPYKVALINHNACTASDEATFMNERLYWGNWQRSMDLLSIFSFMGFYHSIIAFVNHGVHQIRHLYISLQLSLQKNLPSKSNLPCVRAGFRASPGKQSAAI